MEHYWSTFGKRFFKDFKSATGEQLIGALLALGILVYQIKYGVVHSADIRGSYLAILWPYVFLVVALFIWHFLRTSHVLHREQGSILDGLRSELDRERQNPRITSSDWLKVSAEVDKCRGYRVDHHWNSDHEHSWVVTGAAKAGICEMLLQRAGNMLLRSPNVCRSLPDSVRAEKDPLVRWMRYMEEHQAVTSGMSGVGYEDSGDGRVLHHFSTSTRDLTYDFGRLCDQCAAIEV